MIIWYNGGKMKTHPILPDYAASKHLWPGLNVQRRWSLICLIRCYKASPVLFDVDGEHHTNARMQTRHYSFCIWNSRIARSACFVIDSFDGALGNGIGNLSKCKPSVWASWLPLTAYMVTVFGIALLWPNWQHTNVQTAKLIRLKAFIVN